MPVGKAVTPGKPEPIPPGRDEAAALMSDSKELTTPEGSAVTGRLRPDGRLDGTETPGIAEPALMFDSSELTRPVGSAVTGRLTPPGRPDDTTPGITEPALMPESKELITPDGSAVTGRLRPDGSPDGTTPGTAEPALMPDSSELTILLGIAVTAGISEARLEGNRPAADETTALALLRMLLIMLDGSTLTGKLTPPGSGDWIAPGIDVAAALIADSSELTIPVGRVVTAGSPDGRPVGMMPGMDPAFMSLITLLIMPVGNAVTGRLTPPGRPD
jgi:hypothetical protein